MEITVEEDFIVMPSVLVRGVSEITDDHVKSAESWAKKHNRTLTSWGGNFSEVRVEFEPPLTEAEFEEFYDE